MSAPPTAARGNIPCPRRFGEPSLGDGEVFGVAVSPIRTLCSGTCGHLARHAQPSILSRNRYSPSVRTGATPLHSRESTAQPRCEYRPYGEMPPACRANTDPVGKRRGRLRPVPSLLGAQTTRIPTPWGNNTDPVGKRRDRETGVPAPRSRRRRVIGPSSTGFPPNAGYSRPSAAFTDPPGNEYRPRGETIPSPWGEFYRSLGENLPTSGGYFTDPAGVFYRPHGETQRPNYLQTRHFCFFRSVYMVFCLCLMFCLINREELGV